MEAVASQPDYAAREVEARLGERDYSSFEKATVDGDIVGRLEGYACDATQNIIKSHTDAGNLETSSCHDVPSVTEATHQGVSTGIKVEQERDNHDKTALKHTVNRPVRKARLKRRFDPCFVEDIKDEGDLKHDHMYESEDTGTWRNTKEEKFIGKEKRKKVVQPALQIVVPCPIELEYPRRLRTEITFRPRTSRASMSKLKQAAAGCLPLPPTIFGLLEEEEEEEERHDIERERLLIDDQQPLIQSTNPKSQNARAMPYVHANAYAYATTDELQQTPEQRHLVKSMSDAPPDVRNMMLRELMTQKLGGAQAESINHMASLPREQQNMVVQHLLSRMTPQQRYTLSQMKPPQQAELLQRFYERFVLPNMRSHDSQRRHVGREIRQSINAEQTQMMGQVCSTLSLPPIGGVRSSQTLNIRPTMQSGSQQQLQFASVVPPSFPRQGHPYHPFGVSSFSGVPQQMMPTKTDGIKTYLGQISSASQPGNGMTKYNGQAQGISSLTGQSSSLGTVHGVSSANNNDFAGLKVSDLLGCAGFDDMDALQDAVDYFQNEGI